MPTDEVRIGRLQRKVIRVLEQRDYWKAQHQRLRKVLDEFPFIERTRERYDKVIATRERIRDLERRVKEQSALIEHLQSNQQKDHTGRVEPRPIDMVLHCPNCGAQHIDKPEGQFYPGMTADESAAQNDAYDLWTNPPHRSHLCHSCGHIWRPADVPTNGVAAVKTRGKADDPIAEPQAQGVPAGFVWPNPPERRGQSPVLFDDGYEEGWAKCIDTMKAMLAAAPQPAQAAEPVATLHDDGCFTWKRDEFRRKYDRDHAGWRMDVYAAPQRQEAGGDARDGERYRWLRSQRSWHEMTQTRDVIWTNGFAPAELDAAIDAARALGDGGA